METISRAIGWRELATVAACLAASLGGGACGSGDVTHPTPADAVRQLLDRSAEPPALAVGDRSVDSREIQAHWDREPDLSRSSVIRETIDRALLAGRAVASDVEPGQSVAERRKRAMVRSLLERTVEREIGPDDVDAERVEAVRRRLRARLGRPAGIRASHLLVRIREGEGSDDSGEAEDSESRKRRARDWVERIRDDLDERPEAVDLYRVRRQYLDRVPEWLQIVVDVNLQFPAPDSRRFEGELPDGWNDVVEPFAKAAAEQLDSEGPGTVSEPVESQFGWHLVRPGGRLEPKIPDPEAAREVAVSRRLRAVREERFRELWEQWKAHTSIAIHREALESQSTPN